MKKIIFLCAWILFSVSAFAQDLIWKIDFELSRVESEKNWFIDNLLNIKTANLSWNYSKFSDQYYLLKNNILKDYNTIWINLSFLKEKVSDKLFDENSSLSLLSWYKINVDDFIKVYQSNVQSFSKTFSWIVQKNVDPEKLKWAKVIESIDSTIASEKLDSWTKIDIDTIIWVYIKSQQTDPTWTKEKVLNTIAKADSLLADKSLSSDKRYLYLSTKKAGILYLYFDQWKTYSKEILAQSNQSQSDPSYQTLDLTSSSPTTKISTWSQNTLTWDMNLFESIRWYSMYFPADLTFIWLKTDKKFDLWTNSISCSYKINISSKSKRLSIETSPEVEIYECTSNVSDYNLSKAANKTSLIFKKTKDWKFRFLIKPLTSSGKNYIWKIIVN